MTPHAPKTAALEALAADLLSDEGTRRIRAHLRACEVCREHFATIHVYRESQEMIVATEPKVDWSKMELALAREARTQAAENLRAAPAAGRAGAANDGGYAGRGRYPWLLGGAIAVAAAALAAVGLSNGWFGGNTPPRDRAPIVATIEDPQHDEAPVVVAQHAAAASGTVSMIAGAASFASDVADSAAETLAVGQRITNGVVMTGPLGQAAFELERPASTDAPEAPPVALAHVTLGAEAQLSLGEVMPVEAAAAADAVTSTVTSRLTRGRTTIDAFEASSRVVVLAGSYRVEIRAARCTIDLDETDAARVVLGEAHGDLAEVVVVDAEGHRTELTGEAGAWASRTAPGAPANPGSVALTDLPIALADGPIVQITFPDAVRFEVGEMSVEGGPTLALRVHEGGLDVRAFDRNGRAFRAHVDVGPDGLALSPDQLEPMRPRIVGFLPPEDITPIVQRSQRALQRCYEQAMRQHPEIGGGVMRARVTLDSRGAVRVVEIEGDAVPPSLDQCVRQEAATWTFPPPGGPMSFELPLRFRTRQ